MNKLVSNAWVWFAVFCVALFFIAQVVLGACVNWAVQTSNLQSMDNVVTADGSSLIELWSADSYGVTVAKDAIVGDSKPSEQVLMLETPVVPSGLVRVQ